MPATRILVTSLRLSDAAQDVLRAAGLAPDFMDAPYDETAMRRRLVEGGHAAVLMRGSPPITRAILSAAPALRIVAKHGAGVDSVDLAAATEHGVVVTVARGANAAATAELAIALMLTLAREIPRFDRELRAGVWAKASYQGRELAGRLLGIVGFGAIGRRVAAVAGALGMQVVVHSRSRPSVMPEGVAFEPSLDALLARADVVSLHCPLTRETHHLIDARALALMKPDALLINTARGAVVDEAALVEALADGTIAAAGIDTFQTEPTSPDNPLLKLANVVVTPHVGGLTAGAVERVGVMAAEDIVAVLAGRAPDRAHVVNPAVLDRCTPPGRAG